jgi:uncharacterized membrane protein YhfC
MSHLSIDSGWLIMSVIASLGAIFLPLVLIVIVPRRLHVSYKYVVFGMLVFLIFQIATRIPLVSLAGGLLKDQLQHSISFQYIWIGILAITAGLFEEVGRYVGYRWFLKNDPRTWSVGVTFGLGHGSIESILLVGMNSLISVLLLIVMMQANLNALPSGFAHQLVQESQSIATQPSWFPLLGLWERIWTISVHIALSLVVLRVFQRGQIRWLWIAVGLHAFVDFSTVGLLIVLSSNGIIAASLLVELVVFIFGIVALIFVARTRAHEEGEKTQVLASVV